ncbi:helix-turn-helix domain-containing protein [Cupriavidus basilensis]|uniref:Helix-turn-helix domain-containing protein n=1 Tax=Cupriavidus basilensis TaxID=68895 RepID=A0ABT6AGA6_9BURK|nr:helix-turn-helix domain-containing protein [Cupriavidus basilensis]MDF3831632.1 helix-turn-helix domain-containing protein [Cupriavidus basilensis]
MPLRHIRFLVFDRFQVLDVCGPLQVFATANDLLRQAGRPPQYRTHVCSLAPGLVDSSGGVELNARAMPARLGRKTDTLIIPGGPGVWDRPATDALVQWIRRAAPRVERIASVCTGAFLFARTGLLDGSQVVTHWAACDQLAEAFPALKVQRDAIFFREGRYWSSAGVTAGIDMTLGMVEADAGREIAMAVAKTLVVFYKRPGGQSQFSSALLEQSAQDGRIAGLNAWIASHLHHRLDVPSLAERMSMTPRTFARFYRQQTGMTPARAVEKIRLERACGLIESHAQPIKSVAQACGFSSEEIMRRAFVRYLQVSPSEYRERFSGKGGLA